MNTINNGLSSKKRLLPLGALLLILVLALTVAACGSSDDSDGDATASTATTPVETEPAADVATTVEYDGPEADLPTTFPEPKIKDGYTFTVGFPSPSRSVPALAAEEDAVKAEVERLGGKVISTDAQFSVQKQVSDFEQLLSQNVDAIILSSLDPNSLTPLLDKAKDQGVPVFVNDVPFKAGLPPVEGFEASILSGTDQSGYARAKVLADAQPGAKYGLIGSQIPAPMLDYMVSQVQFWGDKLGIEYVDRTDTKTDSPEDGAAAATALLSKNPDLDAIFAFSDTAALGAITAVKQSGNTDVKVIGNNGTAPALEAVKNGDMFATYFTDNSELHKQLVWAAYNVLTDQNKNQPKQVVLGNGEIITKDNTDAVENPIG